MPSRRMIDPAFWQSETVAGLPIHVRYFFIGLFSNADDQGRMKAHPALIRSRLYPYDDIALDDVESWLATLVQGDFVAIYQVDDKDYLQIVNWWKYQRPRWAWPSDHPAPSGWRDRVHYRQGNTVVQDNWGDGETEADDESGDSGATVEPPRDHDGATVEPAPSGSNSGSDSDSGRAKASPPRASATADRADSPALSAWLQARNGTVGPLEADLLWDLVDSAETHRLGLPRGSPGAEVPGDEWLAEAIREAVRANSRARITMSFVQAIAERWMAEGYKAPMQGRGGNDGAHSKGSRQDGDFTPRAASPEEFYTADELAGFGAGDA